jgi:hemolysin III
MWATLTRSSPVFTRPTYSSISRFRPRGLYVRGVFDDLGHARGYTKAMSDEPIPLLRGVLHMWAFWFALAATVPLVALAPAGAARAAALFYGAGMCVLFAGSGLFHRSKCSPRVRAILWRVDHCAIFVFIAASYTPVGLLVLEGPTRWTLLGIVWATGLVGVVVSVAWIAAPRWLVAGLCVGMGWAAVVTLPEIAARLPAAPLVLLVAGGRCTRPAPPSTRRAGPTRGRARSASTRCSTCSSSPRRPRTSWRWPAG